jgi:hypothetical protein
MTVLDARVGLSSSRLIGRVARIASNQGGVSRKKRPFKWRTALPSSRLLGYYLARATNAESWTTKSTSTSSHSLSTEDVDC